MTAAETQHLLLLLRKLAREEAEAALAALLPKPDDEAFVGATEAAKLAGWPSRRAMDQAFRRARARGETHDVEALAVELHGHRRWRRGDLIAWARAHARGGSR